MWKVVSGLFTTLSTHTCICLHWLVIKLAKVIKISHCYRLKITFKCCWPRLEKNVDKKHIKDLSMDLYDRIAQTPPPSLCVLMGHSNYFSFFGLTYIYFGDTELQFRGLNKCLQNYIPSQVLPISCLAYMSLVVKK